jgi:hypothetical protein
MAASADAERCRTSYQMGNCMTIPSEAVSMLNRSFQRQEIQQSCHRKDFHEVVQVLAMTALRRSIAFQTVKRQQSSI